MNNAPDIKTPSELHQTAKGLYTSGSPVFVAMQRRLFSVFKKSPNTIILIRNILSGIKYIYYLGSHKAIMQPL